jgi:hypothetical protein
MITYLILYFSLIVAALSEQKPLSPVSGKQVAFLKIYASHTSYNVPKGFNFQMWPSYEEGLNV